MQYNSFIKDWLFRRKISESIIMDFNIHSGINPILGGECIVIPILDENGEFSFNKYRRSPLDDRKPKYIYDKGGKMTLFGAYKIKDAKNVLITEGEMDCLVAWSNNISAVSSTGGSMSFPEEWSKYFVDKEVIICFDNDEAGGKGMAKVLDIIPLAKILFLPDRVGIKDISDYVAGGGDLNVLIKSAIKFDGLDQVIEDRAERIAKWQSTFFHDAYIKNHEEMPEHAKTQAVKQGDALSKAKIYPISSLIKFTRGNAKCLWHNEKTASLHFYREENKVYCFGCGKRGDAVDVYIQLHNVSFLEAIKALQ